MWRRQEGREQSRPSVFLRPFLSPLLILGEGEGEVVRGVARADFEQKMSARTVINCTADRNLSLTLS